MGPNRPLDSTRTDRLIRGRRRAAEAPSNGGIPAAEVERLAHAWLIEGEIASLSQDTLALRRTVLSKLVWFLQHAGHRSFGLREAKDFIFYLATGHQEPNGRWGNPRFRKPPSPRTVQVYALETRRFLKFLAQEGLIDPEAPAQMRMPSVRAHQVQPFTRQQVEALLAAARRTRNARRDEALLLFLLDTGCRASEACNLLMKDLDLKERSCVVMGKGRKRRAVYFSKHTLRALWNYLREEERDPEDPVFLGERGDPLNRDALRTLMRRLGEAAGLQAVRCSPHTLRHTFAVEFLRAGGDALTLQRLLGHENLAMTNRYVALAQADMANQHRQHSPVEALMRKDGRRT